MHKYTFAWSILAATGLAGSASASTTVNLDINGGTSSEDITLADATSPQYNYNASDLKSYLSTYGNNEIGGSYSDPGLPSPSETFSTSTVKIGNVGGAHGSPYSYLHLSFEGADNVAYLGYATLDGYGDLSTVTYAAAAPEPQSWALLMAGSGLVGGAMRRRRQRLARA